MIKIVDTNASGVAQAEFALTDDHYRPTVLLFLLAATEIALDIFIGYSAYRFFKK